MKSWKNNSIRIMKKLGEIVEEHGGITSPKYEGKGYISFVLNGTHYSYDTDENPFFDFYFRKTTLLKDNKYSMDTISEVDKREWMFDNLFKFDCTDDNIVKAAQSLFDMLCKANMSAIKCGCTYINVPNTYNDGYHKEMVYKERINKIFL